MRLINLESPCNCFRCTSLRYAAAASAAAGFDSDSARLDRMRMYDCLVCGEGKMIDPLSGDDYHGIFYCDICRCPLEESDG